MNIVVLTGGISTERDVAISTGTMVCNSLKEKGHNAILVDVFLGVESFTEDIFNIQKDEANSEIVISENIPNLDEIKKIRKNQENVFFGKNVIEICKKADMVFIALHGENGENGKLQATLDLYGIKYTGSGYLGSALAMNKACTKKILTGSGIQTPKGCMIRKKEYDKSFVENNFKLPCVIKPCSGGSSVGVSIAYNVDELNEAIKESYKYEDEIIIEEYVKGREFSVGILGDKVLPIIEIIPKEGFYDYKNKYQKGLTQEICPANLDEQITKKLQDEALKVYKALNLEVYSRIDFILDANNETYCLEANTLPGMTPMSLLPQEAKVIGLSHQELCNKIIEISLEKYCR